MVLQNDTMQGHKHNDSGHNHTFPMARSDTFSGAGYNGSGDRHNTSTSYAKLGLPTKYSDYYGTPRISAETRSKNATVRLWKRIS